MLLSSNQGRKSYQLKKRAEENQKDINSFSGSQNVGTNNTEKVPISAEEVNKKSFFESEYSFITEKDECIHELIVFCDSAGCRRGFYDDIVKI